MCLRGFDYDSESLHDGKARDSVGLSLESRAFVFVFFFLSLLVVTVVVCANSGAAILVKYMGD